MGGAKSLLGARAMTPTTGLAKPEDGTRVPLDEALGKLEKRGGPFMSGLIAKLRAQARAAAPGAATVAGTDTAPGGVAKAFTPMRGGFLGGVGY